MNQLMLYCVPNCFALASVSLKSWVLGKLLGNKTSELMERCEGLPFIPIFENNAISSRKPWLKVGPHSHKIKMLFISLEGKMMRDFEKD